MFQKKNLITTIFGVFAALPQLLAIGGVTQFGHIGDASISGLISALGIAGLGYFAKDKGNPN